MKRKSIKTYLITIFSLLFLVVLISSGVMYYRTTSKELIDDSKDTLLEIAKSSVKIVESRIDGEFKTVETIANRDRIRDITYPLDEKLKLLQGEKDRNKYITLGISDLEGNLTTTEGEVTNIKDRSYFQEAIKSGRGISDPIISKVNNSLNLVFAVPIKQDDNIYSLLVAAADGNILSSIIEDISVGDTGEAFMINKEGTTIAHKNRDLVLNMDNDFESVKEDPSLKGIVELEKLMVEGKIDSGKYDYNGVEKLMGFAPISSTGWSIGVNVLQSEVLENLSKIRNQSIIITLVALAISLIIMYRVINKIIEPIKLLDENLGSLASGDLTVKISEKYLKRKDEFGRLANSEKKLLDSMNQMIGGIRHIGLNVEINSADLSAASQQMAASTEEVATAVQEIAKGSEFQASNLIEVNDILAEFDQELENMVQSIVQIDGSSKGIYGDVASSDENMKKLSAAIDSTTKTINLFLDKIVKLGESIMEIDKITDLINEISEQTNLLALNAAIEAARAGEAGRGFAVVSEEIRKLAEQTKNSIGDINNIVHDIHGEVDVINHSINDINEEMNSQEKVTITTIELFESVMESIRKMVDQIGELNQSTENVNRGKDMIISRIEEISSEAQQVSASSEEIAASAEEMNASVEEVSASAEALSGMTESMMKEVNKFKILEENENKKE